LTTERWRQIENICHEALELDSERRSAFLEQACAGDRTLFGEVESMLAAHNRAGDFLEQNALELEAEALAQEKTRALPALEFSHYRILSRIGAGGMGEVWLARDNNLDRNVALKFLPVQFTSDKDRLQRFIREAKAASALNHPNIITIHEIGEADSAEGRTHFIATEFIEGRTLRQLLANEELTLKTALDIAIQVAAALDAAHHAGIVHRDIKPENIMVRPDGLVKVLDFGLAKLDVRRSLPEDLVDTAAQTKPQELKTQPGMILGTLRYMSPEQARGRDVDGRTDIFSLGTVLYELIARQPLFEGETSADIIAAIINKEPEPLTDFAPDTPPELERIVHKALAKDARDRYQTARDLQIDLQNLKQESELSARLHRSGQLRASASGKQSGSMASQSGGSRFTRKQVLLAGVVVCAALLGVFGWRTFRQGGQVEIPPIGSMKNVQISKWPSAPGEGAAQGRFSPDGKLIAFTSTEGGNKNIWVKMAMEAGDAQPSTEDESLNLNPIWSPNGEEIAFVSLRNGRSGIWRKPPFGGDPVLIKTLAVNQLCRWSKNGSLIYYERENNLFALDVNSANIKQLTSFAPGKDDAAWFSLSPDEQQIAYCRSDAEGRSDLWVISVNGDAPRKIASQFTEARNTVWHPDNYRVFFSARENGTYQIFVADIDGHQPAQLTFGDRDSFVTDVAADGGKVLAGASIEESNIWKVDVVKAEEEVVASDVDFEFWPEISFDGRTIAYESLKNFSQGHNSNSSILLKGVGSTDKPRLLIKEAQRVKWSPKEDKLAVIKNLGGALSLWVVNGLGEASKLVEGNLNPISSSILPHNRAQANDYDWSPDGNRLVYGLSRNGQSNLWVAAADGSSNEQTTWHNDPDLSVYNPFWASDGRRLAYLSRKSARAETGENFSNTVWLAATDARESKAVFQAATSLRLLGWSATEQELILALFKSRIGIGQAEVELLRVDVQSGVQRIIAVLPKAYFSNIHLSTDKRTIAFTANQGGKDNLWLIPVGGGQPRKITANNDSNVYFSSLAWATDRQTIYFGKQTQHGVFSMITNFR